MDARMKQPSEIAASPPPPAASPQAEDAQRLTDEQIDKAVRAYRLGALQGLEAARTALRAAIDASRTPATGGDA